MADEVVVKEPLTSDMIKKGEEVTKSLQSAGFQLSLSFWLYTSDYKDWRLMIATPLVDAKGPRETYARIGKALPNYIDNLREFDMLSITVVSPIDPLVKALSSAARRSGQAGLRLRGSLEGVFVEDAYVYQL